MSRFVFACLFAFSVFALPRQAYAFSYWTGVVTAVWCTTNNNNCFVAISGTYTSSTNNQRPSCASSSGRINKPEPGRFITDHQHAGGGEACGDNRNGCWQGGLHEHDD